MDCVERRGVFPATIDEVWAAITRPDRLSEWFGLEVVELGLRPGGRIVCRDERGAVRRALVEVVEPPERFTFRWLPFTVGPEGALRRTAGTSVELRLEPAPGGTRLTVLESSPRGFLESTPSPAYLRPRPPDPPGAPPSILLRA